MSVFYWFVLTIVAFLCQTQLAVFGRPVNLSVALIFLFSLSKAKPYVKGYWSGKGEIHAALFGSLVGLIEDALANSIIGPSMMSKSLVGIACVFIFSDVFFKYTAPLGTLILALSTAADYLIMAGIRYSLTDMALNPMIMLGTILVQSLINAPLGYLMLMSKKIQEP